MRTLSAGVLFLILISSMPVTHPDQRAGSAAMEQTRHLKDFQVIELRRYTTKSGEQDERTARISSGLAS